MACAQFVRCAKKIIGLATNYESMLKVLGVPRPKHPVAFLKPTTSFIENYQNIEIPEGFTVVHEVELGVIIGKTCRAVDACYVMEHIGGYCVALDLTATCQLKEARKEGNPWFIAKGFDAACPVSMFLSKEMICDPHAVKLWCAVNGQVRQDCCTSELIFRIPEIVCYLSKYITLEPCDLILTGTPPGIGPIAAGDIIKFGIKDLITLKFDVIKKCN